MFDTTTVDNIKSKDKERSNKILDLDFTCFDFIPSAILVQKDNEIVYVNESLLKIMECDYEWIMGKSVYKLFEEENNILSTKMKHLFNIEDGEYRIKNSRGNEIEIELKCNDEKFGDSNFIFLNIRDISERKQLQAELQESRELYKNLIDILPIGISIHDGKTFSFVSDSYIKILGYDSPNELVGQKLAMVADKVFQKVVDERLNSLLANNIMLSPIEYKFVTKQGDLIDVEVISVRFSYNQKVNIISTVRDITEKKKAEENKKLLERTLEYDRLKTEFFSNISHELRTPLNILLSSLQLIELYVVDDSNPKIMDIRKYIKVMKQNCYRLLRLINNLLDITKIDSGYYGLDLHNHNIVKIVEDMTQSVASYMEEKNIQIIFDTDVEEKMIGCDKDKIEKVVLSLLSNAVKFTKPGGTIDVSVHDLRDRVKISVKDTGIGIPKDKLGLIFERFIQVDKSLSRISEGAGIGLSLANDLIKMHGGTISVTSEYGIFTQFDILIPLKKVENENVMSNSDQYLDRWIDKKDKAEMVNIEFSDIYI
ncbi:hypothetical protein CSC2_00120 [Clostridium zeae]|uniref:histidine kinase n=1 Tax=Clostridium zeae TaxID=2759022 RepID=A0ABQ1E402_9CLOT|nr:PAS domain-containing sensor histidine kinase [Clostridium zeae]GFZ29486.1 hypothetical protein CSC2_00120 [Clostridium zeae]